MLGDSSCLQEKTRQVRRLEQRVNTCETSMFFGSTPLQPQTWLKGGVLGKVERAKAKLEAGDARLSELLHARVKLDAELADAKQALRRARAQKARKDALEGEAVDLLEAAVRSAAPTAALLQLGRRAAKLQATVDFERATGPRLQQAITLCVAARGHYYSALRCLRAALTSSVARLADGVRALREKVPAYLQESGGRAAGGRGGLLLKYGRRHRMQLIHWARKEMVLGRELLMRAFFRVPLAVRRRYPAQCASIGRVDLPSLIEMNRMLDGDDESAAEDRDETRRHDAPPPPSTPSGAPPPSPTQLSASTRHAVGRTVEVLGECERVAAQQEALIRGLVGVVRADGAMAAVALCQAGLEISAEKARVFDELRASHGWPAAETAGPVGAAAARAALAAQVPAFAQLVICHAQRSWRERASRRSSSEPALGGGGGAAHGAREGPAAAPASTPARPGEPLKEPAVAHTLSEARSDRTTDPGEWPAPT